MKNCLIASNAKTITECLRKECMPVIKRDKKKIKKVSVKDIDGFKKTIASHI